MLAANHGDEDFDGRRHGRRDLLPEEAERQEEGGDGQEEESGDDDHEDEDDDSDPPNAAGDDDDDDDEEEEEEEEEEEDDDDEEEEEDANDEGARNEQVQQQQPLPQPAAARRPDEVLLAEGILPPNTPVNSDPMDPRRMMLSEQEIRWAYAIKRAIANDPECDFTLTDMWYGQLALMDQNNVDKAIERAKHLQLFREEYSITDTCNQGTKWILKLLRLMQPVFLSYSYSHNEGSYVLVYDLGAADIRKFNNQHGGFETGFTGGYYLCQALTPDFESMRRGVVFVAECQDFDWKRNLDIGAFRRFWCELMAVYPYNIQKIKYFHSGVFMNMINSLKKRFLPQEIVNKMEYGYQLGGGLESLSDVYLVPTVDAATARTYLRIEDSLLRRYHREQNYRLPLEPTTTI